MKRITFAILVLGIFNAPAFGADVPLEDQLKALQLPSNQAPTVVSKEKLYIIQSRYLPLKNKSEVGIGIAQNFTGDSFFTTRQFELSYRFHFSDRWSLGVAQSYVSNDLTPEGNRLIQSEGIAPSMPYARQRSEMTAAYNVFYGKIRFTSEKVYYFDQYVAAGPGLMMMNTGDIGAGVLDAGFAFWMGNWGSTRLGLKDYIYSEPDRSKSAPSHNLHAHLDLAYLF